jgi:hypothetical protein
MEFYNKKVCCAPPVVKMERKAGDRMELSSADKSVTLIPLTLKWESEELGLHVNDIVYVRSDRLTQPWATEKIRVQGQVDEFVLVPTDEIVAGAAVVLGGKAL